MEVIVSRSYKKTPYCGLQKTKWAKQQANKKVRRYLNRQKIEDESFTPAAYKKVSESWNICDYYDIITWEEHKRWRKRRFHWGFTVPDMKFLENGDIDWQNEYQLWWKWYKRK